MKVSSASLTSTDISPAPRLLAAILSLALASFVYLIPVPSTPVVRAADSVDSLKAKQLQLLQQAKDAENEAASKKSLADRAETKRKQVAGQIDNLEDSIGSTQGQISTTQKQIGEKDQEVASLEAQMRKIQDQQNALLRALYIMRVSQPDQLAIFSNEPVSKRQQNETEFQALKKSLSSVFDKYTASKLAVESARSDLVKKNNDLNTFQIQQQEQKVNLADIQNQQVQLRDNAEAATLALEAKAKQAKIQEAAIEKQISAALSAAIKKATSGGALTGAGVGGRVNKGDLVGHEGSTGNSSGPHVHFEVRLNDTPVNPQPYINNGTLSWPIRQFIITQPFGYTSYAASGAYGGAIHTGIDVAGPYGEPVYAPASGRVILNQWYGDYGNAWAEQLDNGLVVLLGHMTGK